MVFSKPAEKQNHVQLKMKINHCCFKQSRFSDPNYILRTRDSSCNGRDYAAQENVREDAREGMMALKSPVTKASYVLNLLDTVYLVSM